MNRIAIRVFALAVLATAALGTSQQSTAQEWARKMLTEFSHDFGEVKKGDMPEYRFEIKNIYNEDMNIAQVFSSCGCTQVSVSKKKLKTFETGEIICRFNSKPFNGFKQATVTVRFGAPMAGEVQLTVKGTIVSAIRVEPNSIDFGQVSQGKNPVFQTTVTGPPNAFFRIMDIKSTFPHVGVSLQQPRRINNQIQYVMQTRLKESAPNGFSQGDLFIVVDEGNGSQRQIPLKFAVKVASAVQLSPSVLTLNNIKPGQKVVKTVVVRSDQPFQITDVKCQTKAFNVKSKKPGESKTHLLTVSYTGEQKTGRHECDLTFYTNLSTKPAGKVKAVVTYANDEASPEVSLISQ